MANINTLLNLLIAGFLQGILEWLPVSSSGQLMVFLAKISSLNLAGAYSFAFFLHLGTVLSAIVFFSKKIINELGTGKLNFLTVDASKKELLIAPEKDYILVVLR